MSLLRNINANLGVGAQLDAGNRLRVSQQTTQLDVKQINDNAPLFFDRENIGSATQVYSKNLGGSTMSVTSGSDAAICQTKMFANYFSGKSQLIEVTFSGFQNEASVTKRAGYFSSNTTTPFNSNKDGIWFEADGTDYRFRIQKNGTDILNVDGDSWNVKTISESGLDPSKFSVFVIDFLYLGGTKVRFGFVIDGVIEWLHEYVHSNLITSTFVQSPNQPIRYEIRSNGGSGSFDQICAQVSSEGSIDEVGSSRSFINEDFQANDSGTIYAVIGLRLKADYRNISIKKQTLDVFTQNNDDVIWRVHFNPTVSGTFTYNDVDESSLQVALGATANEITDEGIVVFSGTIQGNSSFNTSLTNAIRIGSQINGTPDEIVLSNEPLSDNLDSFNTFTVQEFI